MKILICDPMDSEARNYLKREGIESDYKPDITVPELISSIANYSALLVRSRTKVTQEVVEKGRNLKVVARIGSGFDNIDIKVCKEKGILVVNAPEANSQAVAELTVGLMIAALRDLPKVFSSMKEGLWHKGELWGEELSSKTVGIVGYGHVGKRVEKLVRAFGANVLIYSRSYQTATLQEIFEKGDVVTLHLSLTSKTCGCITGELIDKIRPKAIFVNLARSELVDEEALYEALLNKKIRGGVLDVYWQEPLPPDSKWRKLDNVILTPHIGAATKEALKKASMTVARDVVRVLKGEKPRSAVLWVA